MNTTISRNNVQKYYEEQPPADIIISKSFKNSVVKSKS